MDKRRMADIGTIQLSLLVIRNVLREYGLADSSAYQEIDISGRKLINEITEMPVQSALELEISALL